MDDPAREPTSWEERETSAATRLVRVESWGMAAASRSTMALPGSVEEVRELMLRAAREGRTVTFRGAGQSYGDAALNQGGIVAEMDAMDRILTWDRETGIMEAQPGVRVGAAWRRILPEGWWPPVVPGTMAVSLGGAAAMNIHGKNQFRVGSFGEHVRELDVVVPDGSLVTCSPDENARLFHGVVGGFGMLGCIVRLRLAMKRVETGLVEVRAFRAGSLDGVFDVFERELPDADYLVGWLDAFASGDALGRGVVHRADYVPASEVDDPVHTLTLGAQDLPEKLFGVVPRRSMWRLMRLAAHGPGVRLVNAARYHGNRAGPEGAEPFREGLAQYSFLLDYVPGWKRIYRPGGLVQHQAFVPKERAREVFRRQLALSRARGIPPWLAVLKRHRSDPFLVEYAPDGYSLALDYPVTRRNRDRLLSLLRELDERVIDAGGRFYFAKDATLERGTPERFLPAEKLERFRTLKAEVDPEGVLESDLSRRLFGARWGTGSTSSS